MEAMYSQNAGGALNSLVGLPLGSRVANALVSYVAYLGQTFWPTNLAIFYPHPGMIYTDHINPSWTLTSMVARWAETYGWKSQPPLFVLDRAGDCSGHTAGGDYRAGLVVRTGGVAI